MNLDGTDALLDYPDDDVTAQMLFFKNGLEMATCKRCPFGVLLVICTPGLGQVEVILL